MAIAPDAAQAMAQRRGSRDIDPAPCWAQWCEARRELGGAGTR